MTFCCRWSRQKTVIWDPQVVEFNLQCTLPVVANYKLHLYYCTLHITPKVENNSSGLNKLLRQ